jgi:butyryl-CoA dehydrogenase
MNLSSDQEMILETAINIAKQELAPMSAEVDRKQMFPRDGVQKLAEAGFLGMTVPEELGGGGADALSFVLATEAIAKGCPSTASVFVAHSVVAAALAIAGTDEQKGRLLPSLITGHKLGAFAVTEPASGTNPFATMTKAVSNGDDEFIVNGTKTFITSSEKADVYLVILRINKAVGPTDLSALIIEKGAPGFSFGKKEDHMGLRGSSDGELIFEDCRVSKANLLGEENGYLAILPKFEGLVMLGAAAISLGIADAAADAAINHGKTRQVAGQPIGKHQGIQYLLAEMYTALASAKALTYSAAEQLDGNGRQPSSPLILYMAKLFATEIAIDVTHKALQVHGGTGYSRELPLERYYRDARGGTLHFITSEMLKGMLGQMLMGMPPL